MALKNEDVSIRDMTLEINGTWRKDTRPIAESWPVPQQHPILGVSKLEP